MKWHLWPVCRAFCARNTRQTGVTCSEVQFLVQACWNYVVKEMKTDESRVERSKLTEGKANNCDARCQERHTIVIVGAFFSALSIPPLRHGLIALKLARLSVIVGRTDLFGHGRAVACRALIV